MSALRQGGCLCGQVRYRVHGEPARAGLCHCQDCRRTSGSAFNAFAVWPRADFGMQGNVATFDGRSFCPACGGRLFSLGAEEVEVMVGSLDDAPADIVPDYELWVKRREGWLHALPWTDQYEEDRSTGM